MIHGKGWLQHSEAQMGSTITINFITFQHRMWVNVDTYLLELGHDDLEF